MRFFVLFVILMSLFVVPSLANAVNYPLDLSHRFTSLMSTSVFIFKCSVFISEPELIQLSGEHYSLKLISRCFKISKLIKLLLYWKRSYILKRSRGRNSRVFFLIFYITYLYYTIFHLYTIQSHCVVHMLL